MISNDQISKTKQFAGKVIVTHCVFRLLVVFQNYLKMTARLKANRKKRGHVSAGHGRIGKHRRAGGGKGNAGMQHHHRYRIFFLLPLKVVF